MAKKELNLSDILNKYNAEKTETLEKTGILSVDALLGGGLSPGGTYCFWGPPGSFKTTIAVQILKSYCKKGLKTVFIDIEKALNVNQQQSFGIREYVENGTCLHMTADTYAQVDEICSAIAQSNEIKLVVIDSDTQILPKLGDDVDVSSNQPGVKSRQCSVWITKTKAAFYQAGITLIVLAHARANLNMQNAYGPATKMAGGYALGHVPDAIVQFLPGQKFGPKESPEGVTVHISTDKNKFAPPFKRVDVQCFYGTGIKKKVELIEMAITKGIITQSASFFKFGDTTVRGKEALYDLPSSTLKEILSQLESTE